ncbi:MAG: metal-dependent hydrolase [Pseudomonadota bacterium]
MPKAKTPADLTITPRDRRFGRDGRQARWWMNGDPIASAFFNALSVTFPKGEAFFIESVRAHRDGASPRLAQEIRAFTQQEVMHSREHVAFNRAVVDAGYDIAPLDARVDQVLAIANARPPVVRLAATMALEHYTAILAALILKHPELFGSTDREQAELWRWHAIEEIEHKGVAYDTWMHATADWNGWKRWRLRALIMLVISIHFWRHRIEGTLELLRQDGITGWQARWRVARYLLGTPGVVRRIIPAWATYFLPGFHPWRHDDRALIARADSAYRDAVAVPAA